MGKICSKKSMHVTESLKKARHERMITNLTESVVLRIARLEVRQMPRLLGSAFKTTNSPKCCPTMHYTQVGEK